MQERERAAVSKKRMVDRNAQLKAHETRRSELRAQKLLEIDFIEKREKERKAQAIVEVSALFVRLLYARLRCVGLLSPL